MEETQTALGMTTGREEPVGIFETELDARGLRSVEPVEGLVVGHFEPR
jgi:hypothetical protein